MSTQYDVWVHRQLEPNDKLSGSQNHSKKENSLTFSAAYLKMFPNAKQREIEFLKYKKHSYARHSND